VRTASTVVRVAAFVGGLALVLAVGYGVGTGFGLSAGNGGTASGHAGHGRAEGEQSRRDDGKPAVGAPAGLQVSEGGYTLRPLTTTLTLGTSQPFRFIITGPDGKPVTEYDEQHERDLHLIVVRRDLVGYQHLHPTLGGDGVWSAPLMLGQPGTYRAYADFTPHGAKQRTLGVDLFVPGDQRPVPLPPPSTSATVDGFTVTLDGTLRAGRSTELRFTVTRDGREVTDLQPYLGAYGHLVALRAGDLGYLHVHPEDGPAGPQVRFRVEVPAPGDHVLFLEVRHGDVVRTFQLTVPVQETR